MNHIVEFLEDSHTYIVDGIITDSITQVLKKKFGNMYAFVPKDVLQQAADRGTAIHKAIEDYCNLDSNRCKCHTTNHNRIEEVNNFIFLMNKKKLSVIENEVVVVLEDKNKVVAAGRLDLVMERDGKLGVVDIKSTSKLNKDYLFYQLNLYKEAYEQTYGKEIKWLAGMHLRGDVRKFVEIPIDYEKAKEILYE